MYCLLSKDGESHDEIGYYLYVGVYWPFTVSSRYSSNNTMHQRETTSINEKKRFKNN